MSDIPENDISDDVTPPRCAEDGCDTILSRYNDDDRCSVHEKPEEVAAPYLGRRFSRKRKARPYTAADQMDGRPAVKTS